MTEKTAFCNDAWVSEDEAKFALDDWGMLQAAIVVERMRTCNHKVLDLKEHLERLRMSYEMIGISHQKQWCLEDLVEQCVERHIPFYNGRDFVVIILVTPGRQSRGRRGERPSLIIHTAQLDWPAMHHWYENGQPLVVSHHRNVPPACWSPNLKTRARMQYYLAERQALASPLKYAAAILLSLDNKVTETSVANVIVVDRKQRLICPPPDTVLHGICLKRTLRLAAQTGFVVEFQPISIEAAGLASEILLTGSSGCLWPASRLGDISLQNPTTRPVYQTLRNLWCQEIGMDYVQQAELATFGVLLNERPTNE